MTWMHLSIDLKFMLIAKDGKRSKGSIFLSALLKVRAFDVYSRLPVKDARDYETLKDELLKMFSLTEEGFKQKFKTVKPETGEAPETCDRIIIYCDGCVCSIH